VEFAHSPRVCVESPPGAPVSSHTPKMCRLGDLHAKLSLNVRETSWVKYTGLWGKGLGGTVVDADSMGRMAFFCTVGFYDSPESKYLWKITTNIVTSFRILECKPTGLWNLSSFSLIILSNTTSRVMVLNSSPRIL